MKKILKFFGSNGLKPPLYIYNAKGVDTNHQALKNYNDYNTEDFFQDERFRKWMISGGNEESLFWENFNKQYPEKSNDLRLAKNLFNSLHQLQAVPDGEIKARIWNNVEQVVEDSDVGNETNRPVRPLYRWWWMAAATLLIAGGLAWNLRSAFMGAPLEYKKQVSLAKTTLQETVNNTRTEQTVLLMDGSSVKLKPGSKLSYSDFSEKQRVVYLDGEGYFDVTKDKSKPFIVYAGHIVVQVVGTSFKVVSRTGNTKSNVSVMSGKVKVFSAGKMHEVDSQKEDQAVYLTPNQQVAFDANTNVFEKGLVAEPVQVAKTGGAEEFYFTNTSVNEILRELETAYGVKMRFNNTSLESCKVTAPLGDLPLFRKLDIICQTIGATYEVFGTEIVISGGSCDL
ncbi:FecR family protein [Dyadobacter sp. NIV53]|uniref:FecR family protein n=1 Tax=Dyadobacter sp. NIV53 TaxID=2861765 RepID=UPI001C87C3A4|nr:FecR family protein [Dyadobacter sp. NIV53]